MSIFFTKLVKLLILELAIQRHIMVPECDHPWVKLRIFSVTIPRVSAELRRTAVTTSPMELTPFIFTGADIPRDVTTVTNNVSVVLIVPIIIYYLLKVRDLYCKVI